MFFYADNALKNCIEHTYYKHGFKSIHRLIRRRYSEKKEGKVGGLSGKGVNLQTKTAHGGVLLRYGGGGGEEGVGTD